MSKIEIEIPEGFYFDKETMSIRKKPELEFEYVDLGLPSGIKWATCNVGAEKDVDRGIYLSFDEAQKYNCPSKEQIKELVKNTASLWIVKNGINGRLFIGKNGNHIFLPAAGNRYGEYLYAEGSGGYYWSSTPYSGGADYACSLYFSSGDVYPNSGNTHYYGFPVRPVSK